jgi:competence protein ComEC
VRRILVLLAALIIAPDAAVAQDGLELHFLDVGQGDAVLLRAPSGQTALYDSGPSGQRIVEALRERGVERLDLVIASHNHADHIGGLAEVIREFRPRFYMDNGVPHTTQTYRRVLEAVRDAGAQLIEPTERRISLGDAVLQILPPPGRPGWGHNDNSVGVIASYGDFRASLFGDAERAQQEWMLSEARHHLRRVAVHKASHHGSRNGDVSAVMASLRPEVVVIGVGAGNQYGHPHAEAIALYNGVGAEVYRTDRHGTVLVTGQRSGRFEVRTGRDARSRAPPRGRAPAAAAPTGCIDINSASPEALQGIVHIGEGRARQVVRHRPFGSVRDLTRVSGIGPARLRDIEAEGKACVR